MPAKSKAELEAQKEILQHTLTALCRQELNADGRWYIQKLITRIDKQISNETERLKIEAPDNNDH